MLKYENYFSSSEIEGKRQRGEMERRDGGEETEG
jgi:hypothetical protein